MDTWAYVTLDTKIGTIRNDCDLLEQNMFAVVDPKDDTYQGFIRVKDITDSPDDATAGAILENIPKSDDRDIFVYVTDPPDKAKAKMKRNKLQFIPVVDFSKHYEGTLDYRSSGG